MIQRWDKLSWVILWGAALAASLSPLVIQIAFAVIAVGIIGMAHGASDLAIVASGKKLIFLTLYGLTITLCLVWWQFSPAIALPGFLIASAIHFGLEDGPKGKLLESIARGVSLVTTPAVLYTDALRSILGFAGLPAQLLTSFVTGMAVMGGITAGSLIITAILRRDHQLLVGTGALLLLPPFVGFSMGFLILHALPQTQQRRLQLGCTSYTHYFYATWPILAAAIALSAVAISVLLPTDPCGIRSLFAVLTALAIPHLLITPWFERRNTLRVRS